MALKIPAVLVLAVLFITPHPETKKMKMHNNVNAMKEEVLKRIPIGSSIEYAKAVMKKNGFKCEMMWNDSFAGEDDKGNRVTREGMDFLYCDKEKMAFPLILRRWQIAIIHKNGVVSEVSVSIHLTG